MVEYLYPTIEKTFSLEDLSVPPKNYANFLSDCIDTIIPIILEEHKSKTIQEAKEKYKKQLRKINPGKKDEELFSLEDPLFEIYINGKLKFLKYQRKKNDINISKKISEYENLIYHKSSSYGILITCNNHKKEIKDHVSNFNKALNERYPNRKNKLSGEFDSIFLSNKKEKPFDGFELNLYLRSIPTDCLETNIILCDYGCIRTVNGNWYSIPGIKIKTELLDGLLTIPKKITDTLEKVVDKYYAHGSSLRTSHQISYTENLIKIERSKNKTKNVKL